MERRSLSFKTTEVEETSIPIDYPKIYSKTAVVCFATFVSIIIGGILLSNNLFVVKKPKEAFKVLLFTFIFFSIIAVILYYMGSPGFSAFFFNFIGGVILSEHYFKKYIPKNELYPKKKIWIPLIITILLILILMIVITFPLIIYLF